VKKRALIACLAVVALGVTAGAQMTPWLQWTLLPKTQMSEIVGEASGENAWKMIMETGGYDKDRSAAEFADLFYEVRFFQDRLKEYGFKDVELAKYPGGNSWDAVKGELWEVTPIRQKLASYRDMAAMLATGSVTGEAKGELVWVGLGRPEDLKGKDLAGKIVVTEGSAGAVHQAAVRTMGAAGVISIQGTRPFFDPLQIGWANVGGGGGGRGGAAAAPATPLKPGTFAFQIPPRDGEYLKRRLMANQKIVVEAKVIAETRPTTLQNLVWAIPGTDPSAGEIIFSAHLYEGFVKMGGNDDISGCATLVETARTLKTLIDEGRLPRPKRTIRFIIGPEFSGTGAWAKANKALPIGGGLWTRFHPEDMITSPYKSWRFDATTTRMPEFTAPGLGKRSNHVAIDVEVGEEACGVLYALGGASGGLSVYMDKGQLVYEYNMLIIDRYQARSSAPIRPTS